MIIDLLLSLAIIAELLIICLAFAVFLIGKKFGNATSLALGILLTEATLSSIFQICFLISFPAIIPLFELALLFWATIQLIKHKTLLNYPPF